MRLKKYLQSWAEETAQQLRVVVAFAEDWGSVPSIRMVAHNHP